MWEYESFLNEGKNPAGKDVVRIFMSKNGIQECFFLEYFELPNSLVIEQDASAYINAKNEYESTLEINT